MGTTISQRELRNESGAIMRRIEEGECFTVTRNGIPVADLMPHDRARTDRRRFVAVGEVAAGLGSLPDWDVDPFDADVERLDTAVDESDVGPWRSGL